MRRAAVPLWKNTPLWNIKYLLSGIDWMWFYFQTVCLSGSRGICCWRHFHGFSSDSFKPTNQQEASALVDPLAVTPKYRAHSLGEHRLDFIFQGFLSEALIVFNLQRRKIAVFPLQAWISCVSSHHRKRILHLSTSTSSQQIIQIKSQGSLQCQKTEGKDWVRFAVLFLGFFFFLFIYLFIWFLKKTTLFR